MKSNRKLIKKYSDGEVIHKNLPIAYGLPPKGKKNQVCHNCIFYKNDYCTYWNAPVRDQYWCKAWDSENPNVSGKTNISSNIPKTCTNREEVSFMIAQPRMQYTYYYVDDIVKTREFHRVPYEYKQLGFETIIQFYKDIKSRTTYKDNINDWLSEKYTINSWSSCSPYANGIGPNGCNGFCIYADWNEDLSNGEIRFSWPTTNVINRVQKVKEKDKTKFINQVAEISGQSINEINTQLKEIEEDLIMGFGWCGGCGFNRVGFCLFGGCLGYDRKEKQLEWEKRF